MIVDFYQLGSSPLERVVPNICEKVLASGGRLLIVARADLLPGLDELLWTCAPDSFLPHGLAGAARAEEQPLLLSSEPTALNGAANIMLADGEWRQEALGFARTFFLFVSGQIEQARGAWRALKDRPDVERRYWKQLDGRWVQGP